MTKINLFHWRSCSFSFSRQKYTAWDKEQTNISIMPSTNQYWQVYSPKQQ